MPPKRKADWSAGDKNLTRAEKLLKTRRLYLNSLKNLKSNPSIPRPIRKNLRVSGQVSRFQQSGGMELKYIDKGCTNDVALTSTGNICIPSLHSGITGHIAAISRGAGPSQRVGQQCTIKRINYQVGLALGDATNVTKSYGAAKLYLLLDKQCNGATPVFSDVFEAQAFNTFMSMTNSDRYVILKKWEVNLQGSNYNGPSNICRSGDGWTESGSIPCNLPIKWSTTDSNGDLSATTDNNIFLVGISDSYISGEINLVSNRTAFRLRYSDL